jgi:hypothetical protein
MSFEVARSIPRGAAVICGICEVSFWGTEERGCGINLTKQGICAETPAETRD